MRNSPTYPLASVDNALRLALELRNRPSLRVADAADLLGVARSTAHRLLSMLAYRGFASQDPATRAYTAGPVLTDAGLYVARSLDVRRAARRYLEWVRDTLGETVHVVVLEGSQARFVDGVEGSHALRVGTRIGMLLPAHATSGGKALLAEMSDDDVTTLFGGSLPAVTQQTIGDLDTLRRELERVRRRGYAINVEESEIGIAAVGMCIRGPAGEPVAALAVAAPSARLTRRRIPELVPTIVEATRRISAALEQARMREAEAPAAGTRRRG